MPHRQRGFESQVTVLALISVVLMCSMSLGPVFVFVPGVEGVEEFSKQEMEYYRTRVRNMFYHAYNGYLEHAYPYDELKPITCKGMDTWGSFSLTLVDALDTLLIMGNASEFERASRLVLDSIDFNANVNVSVFETNIRVVGGLLSAHMFSGMAGLDLEDGWPCSGPFLRLAEKMADKLLPAFNTWTGMPYGTVNLRYGVHKLETPITCTAGVGTFLLEFGTLSRLTGNPHYERVALKALAELWRIRSPIGLVGNHVNVQTGQWTATDAGIGAGVDSYFEYLVKGSILFNRPDLMNQFNEYKHSIQEYVQHEDWFLWVSMNKGHVTLPVFQSLEQFWPGILTLVGDVDEAMRIMTSYHSVLKQYGFSPEFFNVPTMEAMNKRSGYPLRPELVESLFYMYQATRDPLLLRMGALVVDAIEHSTKTPCGYATVVNVKDHKIEDRMESFFLSETTKYLYLLFDPNNFIHNPGYHGRPVETPSGSCVVDTGGYVFNTEAHPYDPSIIYCCSARRSKDLQMLERFQDNLDLLELFGLDGEEEAMEEADPNWMIPEEEIPPVLYMPEELERFRRNRNQSIAASPSNYTHLGTDPSGVGTVTSLQDESPGDDVEMKNERGSFGDDQDTYVAENGEEDASSGNIVLEYEMQGSDERKSVKLDSLPVIGGKRPGSQQKLTAPHEVDPNSIHSTTILPGATGTTTTKAASFKNAGDDSREKGVSGGSKDGDGAPALTLPQSAETLDLSVLSGDEIKDVLYRTMDQLIKSVGSLADLAEGLPKLRITAGFDDGNDVSADIMSRHWNRNDMCRIYERDTGNVLLNNLLRLMYDKFVVVKEIPGVGEEHGKKLGSDGIGSTKQSVRKRFRSRNYFSPIPICWQHEAPDLPLPESSGYSSERPSFKRLTQAPLLDKSVDEATIGDLKLGHFRTRQLGRYQYQLMSCRPRTFGYRMMLMGQVARTGGG